MTGNDEVGVDEDAEEEGERGEKEVGEDAVKMRCE